LYSVDVYLHSALVLFLYSATHTSDGITCALDAPVETKLSQPEWAKYYDFTGPLRPALLSPRRTVHSSIRRPDYANHPSGVSESEQRDKQSSRFIRVYTHEEIEQPDGLRHACQMGRQVLNEAARALKVGVSCDELDRITHDAAVERDCYPSPLNYYGFPKSLCTSVNEVICHGIPDYREIQNGGE
jgi:methionyl aminopeptidase